MSLVPDELQYTKSHEWVRREGDGWRIGITDHAQSELTDVVFVEFEKVGKKLKKGDMVASVESVKTVSEVYSPVEGELVAVNTAVTDLPEKVNQDPYGEGWFALVRQSGGTEELLSASDYRKLIGEQ